MEPRPIWERQVVAFLYESSVSGVIEADIHPHPPKRAADQHRLDVVRRQELLANSIARSDDAKQPRPFQIPYHVVMGLRHEAGLPERPWMDMFEMFEVKVLRHHARQRVGDRSLIEDVHRLLKLLLTLNRRS